jgi:hypothetical protein
MQRDFDKRLQRANRLKYISSPNFDPAAAVTALLKWGDRVEELETFYSALAITFPDLINNMRIATERMDGRFEFWDPFAQRTWEGRLQGTAFLSPGWQGTYARSKTKLYEIARMHQKPELSDKELDSLVRKVAEVQASLRTLAKMIKDFDQFCQRDYRKLMNNLFERSIRIPQRAEPLDDSLIDLLSPN